MSPPSRGCSSGKASRPSVIAGVESRKDELKLSSVELLTSDLSAEQALPLRLEVSVTKVLLLQLSHDCDCYFFFFGMSPSQYLHKEILEGAGTRGTMERTRASAIYHLLSVEPRLSVTQYISGCKMEECM